MFFVWTDGGGSSQAQQDAVQNCPQAGKWAISVWGGVDGTDAGQALASCSAPSVAAAYWIDPETQAWLRWFAGRPEISDLAPLQRGQGRLVLGDSNAPPTPTPTLTQETTATSEASPTPEATATPEATPTPEPTATPEPDVSRIIFLRHSVGANLIAEGDVRETLTDLGYEFYDHGYNGDGLVLADGTSAGINFGVPGDNTNPDGLAGIFAQPLHEPANNTFSHLMEYDVIAFKSCFPVSNIQSDEQLAQYQSYYRSIRSRMDQYPNKVFIVITPPPEIPAETDAEAAARARTFADWLTSDEYLGGQLNALASKEQHKKHGDDVGQNEDDDNENEHPAAH